MGLNETEELRADYLARVMSENLAANEVLPVMGFTVTVRRALKSETFPAIGTDSASVLMAALDRFGICAVTVNPALVV